MAEEENEIPQEVEDVQERELRIGVELDERRVGNVLKLDEGYAKVQLDTNDSMAIDRSGLIHSGDIYSAANFTAMAAVNDKNCMTVGGNVKFLAPLEVGNVLELEAKALQKDTKKREVEVKGYVLDIKVFEGTIYVVVFDKHILSLKLTKGLE